MTGPDGDAVRSAVVAVRQLLDGVADGDTDVPVMGTTVTGVAQHLVSCLSWYAHDLAAGDSEAGSADLVPRAGAALPEVTRSVGAWGEVLARTVDGASPQDRGWHPHGVADPAGFAAIGCAELLVHGCDVSTALGLGWNPPADVAAAVVARLFPEVPRDAAPVAGLLWATGRGGLPRLGRRTDWTYAMAPRG